MKVMDFGIALTIRTSASRVGRSSSSGTELYMSPEQLRGRDVGPESDIYSLGATLYELLSGKPPFYKGNIPYQIETQPPVRIKGVSDRLNDIIMKCLEKDYLDRYRSAVALQTDLESWFSAEKSGGAQDAAVVLEVEDELSPDHEKSPDDGAGNDLPETVPPSPSESREGSRILLRAAAAVFSIAIIVLAALSATDLFEPRLIQVPDVTGMACESGAALLERNHLKAGRVTKLRTKKEKDETIAAIRPASGEVARGTAVELDVYELWTDVPRIEGLSEVHASSLIKDAGLIISQKEQAFHPEVPKGRAIGIEGGAVELKSGSEVVLLLSKGVRMVALPSIVGKPASEARSTLNVAGLELDSVSKKVTTEYGDDGIVMSTNPSSGPVPEGSTVDVVVSISGARIPDLAGLSYEDARNRLKELGFERIDKKAEYEANRAAGNVIRSEPGSPNLVAFDKRIRLIVCKTLVPKIKTSSALEMVLIQPGTFSMGSPPSEPGRDDDERQHTVRITKPFYMAATEVTNNQFCAFLNEQGNKKEGDEYWLDISDDDCRIEKHGGRFRSESGYGDHPVVEVTWYGARAFCDWTGCRLPTEAEWEYACRAGASTAFYNGGISEPTGRDPNLEKIGWYNKNSGGKMHPVGRKEPNVWGLYDMHGNVWEWCWDWYDKNYPGGTVTDPDSPAGGSCRVLRGGGWRSSAGRCRSASRPGRSPGLSSSSLGFRLVRSAS